MRIADDPVSTRHRPRRPLRLRAAATLWLACAALVTFAAAGPAAGAIFKISNGQAWSDVGTDNEVDICCLRVPIVSPDGRWIVYQHDAETDDAHELWRAPVAGGAPVRISGLLPSGEEVLTYLFTPDGSRVVYEARQDDVDALELYSTPTDAPAGSYVKLNDALAPGLGIGYPFLSPDSQRVVFGVYDLLTLVTTEIWVAAVDGSSRARRVLVPAGRTIGQVGVTADFSRILYVADAAVAGRPELWSIGVDSGSPIKLNGALVAGGAVSSFFPSPTDGLVVYAADQQVDGRSEIYVVPAAGGAAIKVNPILAAGESVPGAVFTPDGGRVLFVRASAGPSEIWSVAPDGADPVQLTGSLVAGGEVIDIVLDAQHLVYVADQQQNEVFEIYSVPIAGGAITKLNPPLVAGGDVQSDPYPKITADGSRVLYAADAVTNNVVNLYVVPIDGGVSTPVSPTLVTPGASTAILDFSLAADGSRVAMTRDYRSTGASPPNVDLYSTPMSGGTPQLMDACVTVGANVFKTPVFSPVDPGQLFYIADQDVDEQYELYASDLCVFCDGFESGATLRWFDETP